MDKLLTVAKWRMKVVCCIVLIVLSYLKFDNLNFDFSAFIYFSSFRMFWNFPQTEIWKQCQQVPFLALCWDGDNSVEKNLTVKKMSWNMPSAYLLKTHYWACVTHGYETFLRNEFKLFLKENFNFHTPAYSFLVFEWGS